MEQPITTATQFCAVIGSPVAHSLSPAIHNAAFRAMNLDFVYLACHVENVKDALAGMRALGNFRGMSITIPHKTDAMKHVDEIDPADRAIGSINTVICENGRLIGSGTDGPGALKALSDAGVDVDGKKILMIGAGGAGRAIAFTLALKARPSSITLLDLDKTVLDRLASDLTAGSETIIISHLFSDEALAAAMAQADLVIHSTPVGMHPHEERSLVPVNLFRPDQTIFDVVYTPLKTRLLKDAAAAGLETISGVEMFINQAVLQFEKFTRKPAPEAIMRQVVMEQLTR